MKWLLRIILGVTMRLALVAIVSIVAIGLAPSSGGSRISKVVEEGVIEYRLCNVVVDAPAEKLAAFLVFDHRTPPRPPLARFQISASLGESAIGINAITGEILQKMVEPQHQALFDTILASKRTRDDQPEFWPYSDRTQVPIQYSKGGGFQHRWHDPGAGLDLVYRTGFNSLPQLILRNCESSMTLSAQEDGSVAADYSEVVPSDRAAFETFAEEVEFSQLEEWPVPSN